MAGLLAPTEGKVSIGGERVRRPRPKTGLILQDHGLLPWATVLENAGLGYAPDSFRLITEQVTSAVVVLLLVPCVAWWLNRFPLQRDRVVLAVAGHVLGSVLFAVAHYFMLVGMR